MKARVFLVTKLNPGIAGADKYSGDVKSFAYGRNGVMAAYRALCAERKSNAISYGSFGAGGSWLELRDHTGTFRFPWCCEDVIPLGLTAQQFIAKQKEADYAQKIQDEQKKIAYFAGYNGQPKPRQFDTYGFTPYWIDIGYSDGKAAAIDFANQE